jgi:hypothetical protein
VSEIFDVKRAPYHHDLPDAICHTGNSHAMLDPGGVLAVTTKQLQGIIINKA